MFKIMIVFGTRPEVIKLAPVIMKLKKKKHVKSIVVDTGQHLQLSESAIEAFSIKIDYNLHVMHYNQSLSDLTCRLLKSLTKVIEAEKPDLVIVQGDTTSAFVAGLVAFYQHIHLAHVEAGLRSFNKLQPFPEEFDRQAIDIISDWHFAPREEDSNNLLVQGISKSEIFTVGNTIVDALQYTLTSPKTKKMRSKELLALEPLFKNKKMVLITAHRRENYGEPLKNICKAILELAKHNKDVYFVFSVHLNPNIQKIVYEMLSAKDNIILYPCFDYVDFIFLMSDAYCILTDSGGIQEESSVLRKPILVLRETTERHQGIKSKIAKLVGSDKKTIVKETNLLLHDPEIYKCMVNAEAQYIYGDGNAATKIVKILSKTYKF